MNEKESLDLITQMIQNTKEKMEHGTGNIMLMWGYLTVIVSVIVYFGLIETLNGQWNWAWFAIPVIGYPVMVIMDKKERRKTSYCKTHMDTTISTIWSILGIAMMFATIFFISYHRGILLIPMALILMGIGSSFTFAILKMKVVSFFCGVGLALGMGILVNCIQGSLNVYNILVFALGFVLITIIPGHYLNYKARKEL